MAGRKRAREAEETAATTAATTTTTTTTRTTAATPRRASSAAARTRKKARPGTARKSRTQQAEDEILDDDDAGEKHQEDGAKEGVEGATADGEKKDVGKGSGKAKGAKTPAKTPAKSRGAKRNIQETDQTPSTRRNEPQHTRKRGRRARAGSEDSGVSAASTATVGSRSSQRLRNKRLAASGVEILPLPPPMPLARLGRGRRAPAAKPKVSTTKANGGTVETTPRPQPQSQQQAELMMPKAVPQSAPSLHVRRAASGTSVAAAAAASPVPAPSRLLVAISEEDKASHSSNAVSATAPGPIPPRLASPLLSPRKPRAASHSSADERVQETMKERSGRRIVWFALAVVLPLLFFALVQTIDNSYRQRELERQDRARIAAEQKLREVPETCIEVPGHARACGPGFAAAEAQIREATRAKVSAFQESLLKRKRAVELELATLKKHGHAEARKWESSVPNGPITSIEDALASLRKVHDDASGDSKGQVAFLLDLITEGMQVRFAQDEVQDEKNDLQTTTQQIKELEAVLSEARGDVFRRLVHVETHAKSIVQEMGGLQVHSVPIVRDDDVSRVAVVPEDDLSLKDLFKRVVHEQFVDFQNNHLQYPDLLSPPETVSVLKGKGQTSLTGPPHRASKCSGRQAGSPYDDEGHYQKTGWLHRLCTQFAGLPQPESVLKNTFPIRDCWSMMGKTGNFSVALSEPSMVHGFQVEHHKIHLGNHDPGVAPRSLTLIGVNITARTEAVLVDMEYDIDGPAVQQTFLPTGAYGPFEAIKVQIRSNHGASYTCLHRVQVF